MTDRQDMEAVLEAILFVATEPVAPEKMLEVFVEGERAVAAEALETVIDRYQERAGHGVLIDRAAGGFRLVSRPDLHGYLRRFFEVSGSNKLSMAGLETLAIIAYRQPITAPEIQELRGVSSAGVLKTLLERRLIRISGRKEVVGKPFLYATTREFLLHFGLAGLKELPPLEQFEELFGGELELGEEEESEPDHEEQVLRQVAALEDREETAENDAEELREAAEEVALLVVGEESGEVEQVVVVAEDTLQPDAEECVHETTDGGGVAAPQPVAEEVG